MHEKSASQIEFGQVPIAGINLKRRDNIPAGLQALYADEEIRQKIFEILKRRVRPQVDHNRGRPGMDLWRIFVLGVIKRALDPGIFMTIRNFPESALRIEAPS